ncbi:MAG TPA: terminase family protein, partial [Gemmatimonadaceae bacterium]|nr:terminase family protein [Gemmatimonadaceae bacterium]
WREAVAATRDIAEKVDKQERRIELITGGVIEFWSLDTADPGRSRKYARIVIDEAGIVRDLQAAWQEAIRPTLTDYRGDAWFLGTPKGRNFFHQLFVRGQEPNGEWKSWRFSTLDNPHMSEEEIESARADLPEAAFRQEYLGEPADDGGNPFGEGAIRQCAGAMSSAQPVVWGWDLAKSQDYTVGVAIDASANVCRLERWQKPWQDTIKDILRLTGRVPALVDSTGVGDPVLEQLQRAQRGVFEGFKFTAPSKQQLMEGVAVHLQQQRGTIPKDSVLQRELETFEYEYTRTGVRYTAPKGLHDDAVCAFALAVFKYAHRRAPSRPTPATSAQFVLP